jgi:hypothetical protein
MMRLAALTSCLLLSCFVFACDKSEDESNDEETTGPLPEPCGTEWAEKEGTADSIMEVWGAPCTENVDCMPTLGADGVCVENILSVYDLPGGFCTKVECELPDSATSFVHDAVDCDPAGGVTCVGAKDLFSACIIPCSDSNQCGREGYGCRAMPQLASEGDPTFCLMNPVDCCATANGQC